MGLGSGRWGWYDGSSCLSSIGSVRAITRIGALLIEVEDTIKVRMQLSRRARAPGVSMSLSPRLEILLMRRTGKTTGLPDNRERDCEARNTVRSIQRARSRHYWDST